MAKLIKRPNSSIGSMVILSNTRVLPSWRACSSLRIGGDYILTNHCLRCSWSQGFGVRLTPTGR